MLQSVHFCSLFYNLFSTLSSLSFSCSNNKCLVWSIAWHARASLFYQNVRPSRHIQFHSCLFTNFSETLIWIFDRELSFHGPRAMHKNLQHLICHFFLNNLSQGVYWHVEYVLRKWVFIYLFLFLSKITKPNWQWQKVDNHKRKANLVLQCLVCVKFLLMRGWDG